MTQVIEALELDEVSSAKVSPAATPLIRQDMQLVGHVTVELSVEIGTAELTIEQLFALKAGDLLTLVQHVDEPAGVRLNGKMIARGQLVAVDDNFGIQLQEIV